MPNVAMILDVTIAAADDFRSARKSMCIADEDLTVHYAGTLDGLAGLISDIDVAGVTDGVTLIQAPRQDLRAVGRDLLNRLASRGQAKAS